MTTLGFHYFPDESHYRLTDLHAWLPELRAMGARWLTVVGSLSRAIPEAFIRECVSAGVQPIVHIPGTPIRPLDLPALEPLFRSYARWGVEHVVLFAEPNSRAAWAPADWGKTALVERFLDVLIPVLRAQAEAGLRPVFPALKAGGEYWDTTFLEAALAGLARRGAESLARELTFAVNLWTFSRPVDWGAGGLAAWPEVRPYLTPPGSQDQRGFRLFDWYDEIIRDRAGGPRPFICLAGGPRLGEKMDPDGPAMTDSRHASCIQEIAQAVLSGQLVEGDPAGDPLPANLLNVNFWLLCASEASPFSQEGWYRSNGSTLPAVDVLKRYALLAEKPAAAPAPAVSAPGSSPGRKPLRHYVLLPSFEWGISEWHWRAALDFVKINRPACGFSVDEALRAELVTILGNEQGISLDTEARLRQAGCRVERIRLTGAGPDGSGALAPQQTAAGRQAARQAGGEPNGQAKSNRDQGDGPGGRRLERRQPDDRAGSRRD